jgi:hypothetical protein
LLKEKGMQKAGSRGLILPHPNSKMINSPVWDKKEREYFKEIISNINNNIPCRALHRIYFLLLFIYILLKHLSLTFRLSIVAYPDNYPCVFLLIPENIQP